MIVYEDKLFAFGTFSSISISVKEFRFSDDEDYHEWLTPDFYDALTVVMLYPAMYYG